MQGISGVNIVNGASGRAVTLGENFAAFDELLTAIAQSTGEFTVYDPLYPSPSDPGAYFSYRFDKGAWTMTLGNHGWSGGIYVVELSTVCQQLRNLHQKKLLRELGLERVSFFGDYASEGAEKNEALNRRLLETHG